MNNITLKKFKEAINILTDESKAVILKFNPSTTNKKSNTNF